MRDAAPATADQPGTIYLADYAPPPWLVEHVHLTFRLAPGGTRVLSRLRFVPNPATEERRFFLHGEDLTTIRATIDGAPVDLRHVPGGAEADAPDGPFTFEAEVEIAPDANTALEGLYMSNGMYCTQCEAEGFRKITWYPDRPDVMAPFDVRIEGDPPVLLSNGNPGDAGPGWAEWHDPWPKPAYLFALVAGDLHATRDAFTTMEGRRVELAVWVRDGDQGKTAFALDALKRSMAWDERVYGRAYDLDVFNIVAVDDFNMGAMENKGLNVFNSAAVLASPETATDANFERIEGIVAHEYFHNWTGNRITCRDWFQLCLKEGLTVFRDQQFTADERSAPVKRIADVLELRARQFREDAGPLAHPVRPTSFVEINNFYTPTVYEKGAELIGMLRTLVGAEAYDRAVALYVERHDGQACTIEDWLQAFADATGRDLTQFGRWYAQAGTPRLSVREEFTGDTLLLHLSQNTPPTPGQSDKAPLPIPVALGLLAPDGSEALPTMVHEMTQPAETLTLTHGPDGWQRDGLPSGPADRPIVSVNRGFAAPVILQHDVDAATRLVQAAHDTDPFNRWEAGRILAKEALSAAILDGTPPRSEWLEALRTTATDEGLDPAFRALVLAMPSEDDMAQTLHEAGHVPDPLRIHGGAEVLREAVARHLHDAALGLYDAHQVPGPYDPGAAPAGHRALAHAALGLVTRVDGGALAARQFDEATDMTRSLAALGCLVRAQAADAALATFRDRWAHERLVMDKWFALQVSLARPAEALGVARALAARDDFDWTNPNRFRALIGGFAGNAAAFHAADGAGYAFVADWLIRLDAKNPQSAARMTNVFGTRHRYDADRQAMIDEALARIAAAPGLSRDTGEMVARLTA
ncbi:MAG: aminopeptidase N [Shimia sp.]